MTVIAEGCKTCNRTMFARGMNPDVIAVDRVYLTVDNKPFHAAQCEVFLDGEKLTDVMAVKEGEWALRVAMPVHSCTCEPDSSYAAYVDEGPYVVEPAGLRPVPAYEP